MVEPNIPPELRGLDYGQFIEWCIKHEVGLPSRGFDLKYRPNIDFSALDPHQPELVRLDNRELSDILSHVPHRMIERSTLGRIIWAKPLWFRKESTPSYLKVTSNLAEALSSTAFAIAYTDRSYWEKESAEYRAKNPPKQDIFITALLSSVVDPVVAKVIQAQAVLHEVVHTVADPLIFQEGYQLKIPSDQLGANGGRVISGREALEDFAGLTEQFEPITPYSSFYRDPLGKYPSEEKLRYDAISEELAETVSFHILNNSFSRSPNGWKEKLLLRPGLEQFIRGFMNARRVA